MIYNWDFYGLFIDGNQNNIKLLRVFLLYMELRASDNLFVRLRGLLGQR